VTPRAAKRAFLISIQGAFALVAGGMLALGWSAEWRLEDALWAGTVFFTTHAAWAFWSWWRLSGRLVDGYSAFLLSFVLFSGGQMILHALGLLPGDLLDGRFGPATIQRTVLLVNAAAVALHLGAVLRQLSPVRPCPPEARPTYNVSRLRRIALAFVAVSLPGTLFRIYTRLTTVAASGYLGLYGDDDATGLSNWDGFSAGFFTPGVLIALATAPRSKTNVRVTWLLALVKVASSLLLGFRSSAALSLVPMLLLHHRLVKPFSRRAIVGFAAAAIIVVPFVREVRQLSLADRLEHVRSGGAVAANPMVATLQEMGGSMRTVAHTIELVPAARGYDYGRGYLVAATTAVPNLFWDLHPAIASGTYAQWVTTEAEGVAAASGGRGLGFSMIAEAFINFGAAGAPLFCLVVGFLMAVLASRAASAMDPSAAFEAVVLSMMLFYPRGESNVPARVLIWCCLIPYLLVRRRPKRALAGIYGLNTRTE
jgi:hypothetical protein